MNLLAKVSIQICRETRLIRSYFVDLWLQLDMKMHATKIGTTLLSFICCDLSAGCQPFFYLVFIKLKYH